MTSLNRPQLAWTRTPPSAQHAKTKKNDQSQHLSLFQLLKQTISAWSADYCMKLAAALACYAVLSLAPLLVIVFKFLTLFLHQQRGKEVITQQLHSYMGPAASPQLIDNILQSTRQGTGIVATTISFIILFFGASGVFGELQSSMNIIWQVKARPKNGILHWIRERFVAMLMVLGMGLLLLASLVVTSLINQVSNAILGHNQILGYVLDSLISLGLVTLVLAVIYKWLPDARINWKHVWLGAFVSALLFVIGKIALSLYFQYGAPTSAYGVFGSLAAVIIWVYYSAQILFFGAEFTKVYARTHGDPLDPKRNATHIDCSPLSPTPT